MSIPPGTEMFQFPGFASASYVFRYGYPLLGGLPHSDIHGSTPARGSPWLFAACHVLHRLLVPRHPPNALLMLETCAPGRTPELSPCTETILSGRFRTHGFTLAQHITVASEQLAHRGTPEDVRSDLRWQRPETHQNLIHPDKEHTLPPGNAN